MAYAECKGIVEKMMMPDFKREVLRKICTSREFSKLASGGAGRLSLDDRKTVVLNLTKAFPEAEKLDLSDDETLENMAKAVYSRAVSLR